MVLDKDQEDKLRSYETNRYEVVRCEMGMEDGDVQNGLASLFLA